MVKEKFQQLTNTKILNKLIIFFISGILLSFTPSDPTKYKGKATYYGQHWTGRLTASGERFYADSLTAAHKYFKFGTILKVTNLNNDSVCYVKVNDRLPKSSSFLIDLSYGTAKQLNFLKIGVIYVTLEPVDTVLIVKVKK
jgi:rare lipoprotein A